MNKKYDVIVVGAGHAGCEAALASARLGCETLLVTFSIEKIGLMSCNPAIGGVGKGQLVKEVDALGGEMGRAIDSTMVQFKMLNTSKGYAARSSRAQADRKKYNEYMRDCLLKQEHLSVIEDEAIEIPIKNTNTSRSRGGLSLPYYANECKGVKTKRNGIVFSRATVLAPGTFTAGVIHIGLEHFEGGRIGEQVASDLSKNLSALGIKTMRLSTCTTPRLDGKTIDFSKLAEQPGDKSIVPFSFWTARIDIPQKSCFLARTNKKTHEIVKKNLKKSVFYSGKIGSSGARYCPSIEDKVVRFPDKESHTLFIEPEGFDTDEYYANGIFTGFPVDVQEELTESVPGLEKVKFTKPGYGIEYDAVAPTELKPSLELKAIKNLFLAGQINGTTGYEEAAALGLMAGINAAKAAKKKEPLILDRSQAYIGVLIDDLVTKGTNEPYRMFTSRVEYRLSVREDNATERLSPVGHSIGLLSDEKFLKVERAKEIIKSVKKSLKAVPRLYKLLKRPEISLDDVLREAGVAENLSYHEKIQVEISVKYEGYIKRERSFVDKFKKLEKMRIPKNFDYSNLPGISGEIREKLTKFIPRSVGQASRISGVTPAAISVLMARLHS